MRMNKYFATLLLLLSMALTATAGGHTLRLDLKDGTSKLFNLSDKPVVSFDGADLVIATATVSATHDRSEVQSISFEDAAGVNDAVADETVYSYDGHTFSCPGHTIAVYDINGIKVAVGDDSVSLEGLSPNVYIITANNQSFKILKK